MKSLSRTSILYGLILALIVVTGGALRLYRLNWDDNQLTHPDERYIMWVATTIRPPADLNTWAGWQAAFDPRRSPFNPFYWPPQANPYNIQVSQDEPRTFAYGHFPLYLLTIVVNGLALVAPGWFQSYQALSLVGRAMSGLFDVGTLLVTFLLGRRLFGRGAGILAATLLAFTPLHIQLSHFYAFDTVMVFFVTAALWLMVRYAQEKRLGDGLAAGACTGLAIGSKVTAIWLVLIWIVSAVLDAWPALRRREWKSLGPLAGLLAAAFLAFAITNPFALIDARAFVSNVSDQAAMTRGSLDWPYTRQYHATWPYLYPIWQMLLFSLGPALTLAGWAGLAWGLWRAWRQTIHLDELAVLMWAASYFALTGGLYVKFVRYMLPIVPVLAILAAAMLLAIQRRWRLAGGGLISLSLAATLLSGWAFVHVYDGDHPWIVASRWIYANAPTGALLAVEHWDDRLPLPLDIDGHARSETQYIYRELQLYNEPDSLEKLDGVLGDLAASDYLVLSTHRLWGTIPRWPERYPLTTRYYQAMFGEQLGYRLAFFAARYPHLGPVTLMDQPLTDPALPLPSALRDLGPAAFIKLEPSPELAGAGQPIVVRLGRADESFTVYDHPLVLIFRNVEHLSPEQMRARVTGAQ